MDWCARHKRFVTGLALAMLLAPALVRAQDDDAPDPDAAEVPLGFERTPPRLGELKGDVAFWRESEDWGPARRNTPLAEGDRLAVGDGGRAELQVGAESFVRAGEQTDFAVDAIERDELTLRLLRGRLAVDARDLAPGQVIHVDAPNARYALERAGYYRIETDDDLSRIVVRRDGEATALVNDGEVVRLRDGDEAVVRGSEDPSIEVAEAPKLDSWDRWNLARTREVLDARSDRYLPRGVYGASDLDRYGRWRDDPSYGAVWYPSSVASGWAPYTTGRWIYDPYYGWTWIDDAPWGWAPYHYGRWVVISHRWAWAPGPVVVRAVYAPALVAFVRPPVPSVHVSVSLGWVALGWGEPLVPWWGPHGCRGVPRWAGWGGPRFVNGVVLHRHHGVHAHDIHVYRNAVVPGAVVVSRGDRFGHGRFERVRLAKADAHRLAPVHGDLGVRPERVARERSRDHERWERRWREAESRHPRVEHARRDVERPRGDLARGQDADRAGVDRERGRDAERPRIDRERRPDADRARLDRERGRGPDRRRDDVARDAQARREPRVEPEARGPRRGTTEPTPDVRSRPERDERRERAPRPERVSRREREPGSVSGSPARVSPPPERQRSPRFDASSRPDARARDARERGAAPPSAAIERAPRERATPGPRVERQQPTPRPRVEREPMRRPERAPIARSERTRAPQVAPHAPRGDAAQGAPRAAQGGGHGQRGGGGNHRGHGDRAEQFR